MFKIINKDVFALCNFDQCMHYLKQKRDTWGNLRMNSMSHKTFKFFGTTSFFALRKWIFTINEQYSMYTHVVGNNMEIHFIFTFLINLFPFMFIRSTNFWIFINFFGLWVMKAYRFCKMPFSQCTRSRFNKISLMSKKQTPPKNGTTFSFNYNITTNFMAMEHTWTITIYAN